MNTQTLNMQEVDWLAKLNALAIDEIGDALPEPMPLAPEKDHEGLDPVAKKFGLPAKQLTDLVILQYLIVWRATSQNGLSQAGHISQDDVANPRKWGIFWVKTAVRDNAGKRRPSSSCLTYTLPLPRNAKEPVAVLQAKAPGLQPEAWAIIDLDAHAFEWDFSGLHPFAPPYAATQFLDLPQKGKSPFPLFAVSVPRHSEKAVWSQHLSKNGGRPAIHAYVMLDKDQKPLPYVDWQQDFRPLLLYSIAHRVEWPELELALKVDILRSYSVHREREIKEQYAGRGNLPDRINVPRQTHKAIQLVFDFARFLPTDKRDTSIFVDGDDLEIYKMPGAELEIYRKETSTELIEYYVNRAIIGDKVPSPQMMARCLKATVFFAVQQRRWDPVFTLGDKVKFLYPELDLRKGGKRYGEVERADKALASIVYHRCNKKRGKDYRETIKPFYAGYEAYGKGRGGLRQVFLRPEDFPGLDIETGRVEGRRGYVVVRLEDLREKDFHDRLLRAYLRQNKGMSGITLSVTQLLEKMGISEKTQGKLDSGKKLCYLRKAARIIREEDFSYEIKCGTPSGDLRTWKYTLRATQKKKRRTELTSAESDLVDKITQWHCQPKFEVRKRKQEIWKQVKNTVLKYGAEQVSRLWGESQWPPAFWARIGELKEAPRYTKDFEAFWALWPAGSRVDKYEASLQWGKRSKQQKAEIMQATPHYIVWCSRDNRFLKHPKTFIGRQRPWLDFIDGPPSGRTNARLPEPGR